MKTLLVTCSLLVLAYGQDQTSGQYGIVYSLDLQNRERDLDNSIEEPSKDFKKLPENGLLLIRLLPREAFSGTILEDNQGFQKTERRTKRSPGRGGGGCNTCGGGGGGGGYPGGGGGYGGHGGGGGGGGGKAGAWSQSSSSAGAYGSGYGKG